MTMVYNMGTAIVCSLRLGFFLYLIELSILTLSNRKRRTFHNNFAISTIRGAQVGRKQTGKFVQIPYDEYD